MSEAGRSPKRVPGGGDPPWVAQLDATYGGAVPLLVSVVQDLSLAHTLEDIVEIVRHAARRLVGSDGATFVLRDGDLCHYVDEDAIGPLWKGKRLPMSTCISGWVMEHRRAVAIPDIFADQRIPHDAYRITFVRSLAVVPIRRRAPLGCIGAYWAYQHEADEQELALLQALADSTSIALENARAYSELEARVRARTEQLEEANRELEAFSHTVAHDLRNPLAGISGYQSLLLNSGLPVGPTQDRIQAIGRLSRRMGELIDDLLRFSRVRRNPLLLREVDLTSLAHATVARLSSDQARPITFEIADGMSATGDPALMRIVLENLLGNAVKYSSRSERPIVRFLSRTQAGIQRFCVEDNGVGFDPTQASRLFRPFQRLHEPEDFPGTGLGLATVARIVERHGGAVWAEGTPGRGATFSFSLP